jgi:RHS repeat-associated protein
VSQTEPDGEQCGDNTGGTAFRQYAYTYDLAGNRTQEVVTVNGTPTTANYTYNAANQISNTGFVYDAAGRMTSDGVNTYVWDRANRLLSMGGSAYTYDGLGNRLSQTVNSIVTSYLNDVQPGLTKVLAETTSGNTIRYVHGPRGIQAMEDSVGGWTFPVQDGLGSVRDDAVSYSPYGVPDDTITGFAFTGEMRDANGLQFHRARYYVPELGVWTSLDPVEGVIQQAMSLDRYIYVEQNPTSWLDPSGLQTDEEDREVCETQGFGSFSCKRFRAQQTIDLINSWTEIGNLFGFSFWWMRTDGQGLDIKEAAAWILQNEIFTVIGAPEAREWITQAIYRTLAHQCSTGFCSQAELASWYAAYTVIIADYSDRSSPNLRNISAQWFRGLLTTPSNEAFRYVQEFEEQSGCSWNPDRLNTGIDFQRNGGCYNHILSRIRQTDLYVSWWDENEIAVAVRSNYTDYNRDESGRMENTCFAARWSRAGDNKKFFIGSEPQRQAAAGGTISSCEDLQSPPESTSTSSACLPHEVVKFL